MSLEVRECIEVGLGDLSVGIRIEDSIYFWTATGWPNIEGLHREIAKAMLSHALTRLDEVSP